MRSVRHWRRRAFGSSAAVHRTATHELKLRAFSDPLALMGMVPRAA